MASASSSSSVRDQAEVIRSASEARKTVLAPVDVGRYLRPPPDTVFALEYAFYLLGDVSGRTVLDLGCGSGENLIPLVLRGANVIGLDISPDLVSLARERLSNAGLKADLRVASAYDTGLPNESVDVVFSMALLHHLDLPRAHTEIRRILRPGGRFILKEPIRFSRILTFLRRLFPDQEDVSDFEHPLTREELATITTDFTLIAERSFRLPTSVLLSRYTRIPKRPLWNSDRGLLRSFPKLTYLATVKVMSLWK